MQIAITALTDRGEELLNQLDQKSQIQSEGFSALGRPGRSFPVKSEEEDEQRQRFEREAAELDPEWDKHLSFDWMFDS